MTAWLISMSGVGPCHLLLLINKGPLTSVHLQAFSMEYMMSVYEEVANMITSVK